MSVINLFFGSDCSIPHIVIENGKVTINGKTIVTNVEEKPKKVVKKVKEDLTEFKKVHINLSNNQRKYLRKLNELALEVPKKTEESEKLKLSNDSKRKLKLYQQSNKEIVPISEMDFLGYRDIDENDIESMFN